MAGRREEARRSSMVSPMRARRGEQGPCATSAACTWWSSTMRGSSAHTGLKNGIPFQISIRPSGRPRRPAIPLEKRCARNPHAVAARLADHLVSGVRDGDFWPGAAEVRMETSRPTRAQAAATRWAWSSEPPASGSSKSRQASSCTRCRPAFSARAATASRRVGGGCSGPAGCRRRRRVGTRRGCERAASRRARPGRPGAGCLRRAPTEPPTDDRPRSPHPPQVETTARTRKEARLRARSARVMLLLATLGSTNSASHRHI